MGVEDNTEKGNITEVTSYFPRASFELKTLDYMSSNRNLYDEFKDNDELFEDVKKMEVGYRSHRFPMLKQTTLVYKDVKSAFKDGDIIAITTKTKGLDVTHMGIVKMIKGNPHLIHASSRDGKVVIDKDDLAESLRRNRSASGVRVIRIPR